MLTFDLEKPFTKNDIENALNNSQNQSKLVFKKLQIMGFVILALTVIGGYFWGIGENPQEDFTKIMTLFLPATFGLFNLLCPYLHRWAGNSQPEIFEYLYASIATSHNCQAFIQMPGMEKYKEYVEKVKQQGRSFTNFECNAIIKHYESLIK